MTNTLETQARRSAVLAAVQRLIFCGISGKVLDIDDAYLVTAREGSGATVLCGDAWRTLEKRLAFNGTLSQVEVWEGKTGEEVA